MDAIFHALIVNSLSLLVPLMSGLWQVNLIYQCNDEKGVKKGLLDGIEQGMPKGDSWIVRFHYPQNLKFLMLS